jgi:uncharacterized RDD family membrane protein YckC
MEEKEQIPTPQPDNDAPSTPEVSGDLPVVEAEVRSFAIAGFWRRVLAIILDITFLAIPLIILGFVFEDLAFSLGPWGRLFGYGIMFLYWGCLTSKLGKGQTIGKKIMKIAVVDSQGSYLALGKALLRALILVLMGLLNGWNFPYGQDPIVVVISSTFVFGGGLAVGYGLIFNRKTRQGIHDLLVKSYVVKGPTELGAIAPEIPRLHTRISYGLVGLGLVLGIASLFLRGLTPTFGVLEPGDLPQMMEIRSAIANSGDFFNVSIQRNNRQQLGNSNILKDLDIKIWAKKSCARDPEYCHQVIMQSASTVFERFDNIDHLSGMVITVTNVFDLGLATGNYTKGIAWSIEDWRKNLNK